MHVTTPRLVSVVIAIGYAVALIASKNAELAFKGCFTLLLPLALIWFPEELGSLTGYFVRGHRVTAETPAVFVAGMGWFFLVGLPALILLLS
jgi:hypothetical protein